MALGKSFDVIGVKLNLVQLMSLGMLGDHVTNLCVILSVETVSALVLIYAIVMLGGQAMIAVYLSVIRKSSYTV